MDAKQIVFYVMLVRQEDDADNVEIIQSLEEIAEDASEEKEEQELRFVPIRDTDMLVMVLYYEHRLNSKSNYVFNIVLVLENNSLLNFESSIIINDEFV